MILVKSFSLLKLLELLKYTSHGYDAAVYSEIYPGCEKGHDKHRFSIVRVLLSDLLTEIGIDRAEIFDVWNNSNLVLSAILQSALSVDRLDFVARDTLYTATTHFGFMEIDRIINNSSVYTKEDGKKVLAYNEKIITDVVQGLNSRLHMYNEVYLNKTVIAASCLIEGAIQEASPYLNLVERTNNLSKFIYLNDSVMDEILNSTDPDMEMARYYAKRLYHRDLPKLVSEEKIYLSPKGKITHEGGTFIEGNQIVWIGRLLTNDFSREFKKHDIHIYTSKGHQPFEIFWKDKYPQYPIETYYIKRVYSL